MDGLPLIILLLGALALTALCRRAGLPAPLVLVVAGLGVSAIPGIPPYALDPELVLFLVLPPLLYSTALSSSSLRIRANIRPIGLLAVGLVLFTTAAVGLVAWWLVPGLGLASALVLGAVVAPPDAVAAVAIGRRLGLPRRMMTVLAGESLFNDATALTALRIAVAAAAGAGFSLAAGIGEFVLAAVGGALLGAVLGRVVHRVRLRLGDPDLESALGLVVPFGAYALAEQVHTSGVLAVVMCGLYLGHHAPEGGYATRLQDRAVWRSADTVLEAFVFALIGLQLPAVVAGVGDRLGGLVLASGAVLATTVLARIVWVYPAVLAPKVLFARRATHDVPLWRIATVISWAGMRGVVTLAAASSIPLVTMAGAPFPGRDEIVFLAFVVTVGTLLLQGLTLPALIRVLGIRAQAEDTRDVLARAEAAHAAAAAGLAKLDEIADGSPDEVVSRLRALAAHRSRGPWEQLGRNEVGEPPSAAFRRLRLAMLDAEREVYVRYRDWGRLDDEVLDAALGELDLEEAMLRS